MSVLYEDPNTGDLFLSDEEEAYEPLGGWEALEGLEPPDRAYPDRAYSDRAYPDRAYSDRAYSDEASSAEAHSDQACSGDSCDGSEDCTLMQEPYEPLEVFDSEELTDLRFPPVRWVIEGFLKPGLTVLAGAPKVGKSWLVLQLCMKIAKGEPLWGMPARRSQALYIALEDSALRLQQRVVSITDTPSKNLYLATSCSPLGDELERELGSFVRSHLNTRVIVIDTFQKIRGQVGQMSYANDYAEVSRLKRIADDLQVCLILVHHTRKLADTDRFNEISGTNGIAGCADTLMVLKKEKRTSANALLSVTGRDITDRELRLRMDRETCVWDCDTPLEEDEPALPEELEALRHFVRSIRCYEGTTTALSEILSECVGRTVPPTALGRMLNRFRYELEDGGVSFHSTRTAGERSLTLIYSKDRDRSPEPDEE